MKTKFDRWFDKNEEDLRDNFMHAYGDLFADYCEREYKECPEDYKNE